MRKTLAFFFILLSILLLIGRDHFILGSLLVVGRWPLVAILVWLCWKSYKKKEIVLGICITLIGLLLLADFTFIQVQKEAIFHHPPNTHSKEIVHWKVLTFNMLFTNKAFQKNITVILQENADIVCLQEVTPKMHPILQKKLSKTYPYSSNKPLNGTHGSAIYSKYPLNDETYLYNKNNLPIAQCVNIFHRGRNIAICNVHTASPAYAFAHPERFVRLFKANVAARRRQAKEIMAHLEEKGGADGYKMIIGDLNTLEYEPAYRDLRQNYVDTYRVAGKGLGFTFPNTHKLPFKTARLDYIFLKGKIACTHAEVLPVSTSDHFGVTAYIGF